MLKRRTDYTCPVSPLMRGANYVHEFREASVRTAEGVGEVATFFCVYCLAIITPNEMKTR